MLGARNPQELATFHERLLGRERGTDRPNWITLRPTKPGTGLSFQLEENVVAPAWPSQPGEQRTTHHLDIAVEDLDAGVAWAIALGATVDAMAN